MNSVGPKLDTVMSESLGSVFPVEIKANHPGCLLAVENDSYTRDSLSRHLREAGYRVVLASNAREAVQVMQDDVHVVLWGISLASADSDELACVRQIREQFAEVQIVILGEEPAEPHVLQQSAGFVEYLGKTFDPARLISVVAKAKRQTELARACCELREAVTISVPVSETPGATATSQRWVDRVTAVADLDLTLLVTGEKGTGKSTAARMIHQRSSRAKAPFITVNCASLPRDLIEAELFGYSHAAFVGAVHDRPGKIELADGGTFFLDEIDELPLTVQTRLLDVLQNGSVQRLGCDRTRHIDVRFIAATAQDLPQRCHSHRFSDELYGRLNSINLHLPPLRERRDDITSIIRYVLEQVARTRHGHVVALSPEAIALLEEYAWPGNLRELESTLEQAAARCYENIIQPSDIEFSNGLTSAAQGQVPNALSLARRTLADIEKQAILDTLQALNGNKAKTARELGISEKSIYNKMRRHGLM